MRYDMQGAGNIDAQAERLSSGGGPLAHLGGRGARAVPGPRRYNLGLQQSRRPRGSRAVPAQSDGGTDAGRAAVGVRLRDVDIAALSDADLLAAAEAGAYVRR